MRNCIALFTFLLLGSFAVAQQDLDTSAFDRNVRIQDDLFLYVNGTWLKNTEIPSDKSDYGSFIQLADLSLERIRDLIEEVSKESHPVGSDAQKVGDFFRSFMNEDAIEAAGLGPIADDLEKIDVIDSKDALFALMGYLQTIGVESPVGFFVDQDDKDSTRYMAQLVQSGLTLPDRDYYLKDDEKSAAAQAALKTYIKKICALADIDQNADDILKLETQLAEAHWERTKLRQADLRYNKHTLEELAKLTPNLNWKAFFDATQAKDFDDVNVMTPSYFEELQRIVQATPLETWKNFLKFKLIDDYAPMLSKELVDAHFDLHSKAIAGIPEQKPRWKRGVELIAGKGAGDFGALGDVVGKLYVEKYFPPDAKAQMDILVQNLLTAFGQSIDGLTWMTDATKVKAKEKLSKITTKIGYPDKWRDYSDLTVNPKDLMENCRSSRNVEYARMINKLGQPVDRLEWGMTPQTVNAYYNPSLNEIVFPAAILQSPFFSKDAEPALNYGGIGAVIGHEISHAFDDQGSQYDAEGNLKNWWSDEDRDAFKSLTEQLVAQYSEYEPVTGKNVNGKLTLGENIADLSGLSIAYKAYQLSLNGQVPPKVAGWTGQQLFFVGWSRVWQRKYREAEMIRRLLIDPHSPSQYRANGPVMNIDAFYQAFDVKEGDRLFKPVNERIRIW